MPPHSPENPCKFNNMEAAPSPLPLSRGEMGPYRADVTHFFHPSLQGKGGRRSRRETGDRDRLCRGVGAKAPGVGCAGPVGAKASDACHFRQSPSNTRVGSPFTIFIVSRLTVITLNSSDRGYLGSPTVSMAQLLVSFTMPLSLPVVTAWRSMTHSIAGLLGTRSHVNVEKLPPANVDTLSQGGELGVGSAWSCLIFIDPIVGPSMLMRHGNDHYVIRLNGVK